MYARFERDDGSSGYQKYYEMLPGLRYRESNRSIGRSARDTCALIVDRKPQAQLAHREIQ